MPIVLNESGMIEHAYRNPETKVGKGICPSHIVKVWKSVTTIILRSLCTGRGVKLPKFFVATFRIVDADPHYHAHHGHFRPHSNSRPNANTQAPADFDGKVLKKHPHIYLSEELASKHNIHAKEHIHDTFDLPEADLNLSNVAKLCHLSRNQVELCLEEIFIALDRSLVEEDVVELSLNEIGKVVIDTGLMKTEFSHSFLSLLGYSEDIKRCFYPHYAGSARVSSLMDYPASVSSSSEDSATLLERGRPSTRSRGKQNEEEWDDAIMEIPPTPPDTEEEDEEGQSEESLPVEESEEDKMRRANAHRTLLERECVVRETFLVWETISKYIIRKTIEGLAVKIPGLGIFSHAILPNDSNNKMFEGVSSLRKSRKFPVFKICSHLKEMNSLKEESETFQCNVPVINLSIGVIAKESKISQGIVEGILTETLLAFARGVITNKTLQFPFPFIGKLHVDERLVYMSFYEEFCEGLEFNFRYDPSYFSSVIPGQMTPLIYHRPPPHFNSVFHYKDMKRVEEEMRASTPCVYGEGEPVIRTANEDECKSPKNSTLRSKFICLCCKCRNGKSKECEIVTDSEEGCSHSRNNERMRQACCAKSGSISFRQPDGSSFSPEPLFTPSKTGNPILDRMADDKCLMQHALGRWMKRNFIKTLGREEVAKHYDREYFKNQKSPFGDELEESASDSCMVRSSMTTIPTSEADPASKVATPNVDSVRPSSTDSSPQKPVERSPSVSIKSTESMLHMPKFTGKDSMIMGLSQRRASEGSKDSKKSHGDSLEIYRRSFLEDPTNKEYHSRDQSYTSQRTSAKDETGSVKDTSEPEGDLRTSVRSATTDEPDGDAQGGEEDSNKKASSQVEEDETSKRPTGDKTSPQQIFVINLKNGENGEEGDPAVHIFESDWFNKPDGDKGSEPDIDMPVHLNMQEDEVMRNLGIKKKKKCKPVIPSKSSSKESLTQEQDTDLDSDKKSLVSKKRSSPPVTTRPSPPVSLKAKYQPRPIPPPRPPRIIQSAVASHNLGPKKPYERKPVMRPKPVPKPKVVKVIPEQDDHAQMLSKGKYKDIVLLPKPVRAKRASSEEKCPSEKTASLVFKSASSILCCSPPTSVAPLPLDYHWHKPLGNFGKTEPYRYVQMSAKSGDSYRNVSVASTCPSRVSRRKLERCESTFCSTYPFEDSRGPRRDRMANNDARDWPTAADTPNPSMTNMCYATFSPMERRQADICYRNVCPTTNVDDCCACPNNYDCDCDI